MAQISRANKAYKDALCAVGLKACGRCKEVRSRREFAKNSEARDGLYSLCVKCHAKWYAENREIHLKNVVEYQASLRGRITVMRAEQNRKTKQLKGRTHADLQS